MKKITPSFLKTVENAIDECSSIVQLRSAFIRFQPYIYHNTIHKYFLDRLDFLEQRSVDAFISNQCEELRDEVELERSILAVAAPSKHFTQEHIEVNMTFYAKDGELFQSCVEELVRLSLSMARGKRAEAARIMGLSQEDFDIVCGKEYDKYIRKLKREIKK